MPALITGNRDPSRKVWTRAEYEALADIGPPGPQHRELVEGQLIHKTGKKRPHTNSLVQLQNWLAGVFGMFCGSDRFKA